jgi:hypothetical protein
MVRIESDELGIYVVGEDLESAIKEFKADKRYFTEYYGSLPADRVIGEARARKELYAQTSSR